MATRSGTLARIRLRAAVRRQSWRKRVGTPAAWQAVRHAVRQRRSDIGQDRDVLDASNLANVVDPDDILVGDLPSEKQLALEAKLQLPGDERILHDLSTDHLERDRHAQLLVPGLVARISDLAVVLLPIRSVVKP